MGKLIKILLCILVSVLLGSCIESGYYNKYGIYVPKKPKYRLKDKSFVFPPQLDTINVYKYVYLEHMGKVGFSLKDNIWPPYSSRRISYMKFYPKGRCIVFSVDIEKELKEHDLNPNYALKGYYVYNIRHEIHTETFGYGQGYGQYLNVKYFLSNTGDTLISDDGYTKRLYIKEKLPDNWKKYPIDW